MSLRLTLAAAAATLAFAAPALAQNAAPAAPAEAAPVQAKTPAEVEMEARAEVFQARMETLQTELTAVVEASGGDQSRSMAEVDAVLGRYQSDFETFAASFETFIDTQLAAATDDAERQELTEARAKVGPAIRGIAPQIRMAVQQAIAAEAAAPAAAAPQ
ncbi:MULTISPECIES: hypothetical protein [unclassified Brevundimonas]|uniref:hypothetical protein n=1 Tax=unclassified Brevundimonas TaxID=2622653 RepID=UPI003F909F27